jgi:hypothetical protein
VSITPAGRVMLPLFNVRKLLGDCPSFQTMLAVGTADAATAKTYYLETDEVIEGVESPEAQRPRCILSFGMGNFRAKSSSTTGFMLSGPVLCEIEIPVPAEYVNDYQQGIIWWGNQLGDLFADLMARGVRGNGQGYINLTEITLEAWGRADPDDNNGVAFFGALFEFEWQGI